MSDFRQRVSAGACQARGMSLTMTADAAGVASMSFDERYRAIDSRDVRFDGQFVTAVRSTGIYCRPSCPARTPKPSNVTFYATSAAAHEAGYRACKRCLPEAAPGSPQWNLRGDTAGRAMRLIADGVVEREGVPGLARAARLLAAAPHAAAHRPSSAPGPSRSAARTGRRPPACCSSAPTSLPPTSRSRPGSRASASSTTPSARCSGCRRSSCAPGAAARPATPRARRGARVAIDLVLPHRGPLDADGLFAWMAARAVAGCRGRAPTRPSPARCASPAVPRGSSCASTTSAACGCGPR